MSDPNESPLMLRAEVLEYLRVSDRTLREWERAGVIRRVQYAPQVFRYVRAEIVEFANKGRTPADIAATSPKRGRA